MTTTTREPEQVERERTKAQNDQERQTLETTAALLRLEERGRHPATEDHLMALTD